MHFKKRANSAEEPLTGSLIYIRMERQRSRSRSPLTLYPPLRWRPTPHHRRQSPAKQLKTRRKHAILALGSDLPPALKTFKAMRFPKDLRQVLKRVGVKRPTALQMQALPAM